MFPENLGKFFSVFAFFRKKKQLSRMCSKSVLLESYDFYLGEYFSEGGTAKITCRWHGGGAAVKWVNISPE